MLKRVLLCGAAGLAAVMVLVAVNARATSTAGLKVGDPVPNVSGVTDEGGTLDLAKAGAHGYLLVYFYPKALTPGCTAQACSLRDAYAELTAKGIGVVGVSLDPVATQKRFRAQEHLPFPLIADTDRRVTRAFGVPLILNAAASRQAFLFKDGKLVWADAHASTAKQAQDVLAAVGRG